ncbi:MAG: DNA mismatch repair protein MutL [Planctomycetes bacterium]|jgi:DNA mismatch repair protein MutL|nr:DNA mismatch repair protein MutL [Planctomycetota bacterium]MDP6409490.1 DNA mismatch repair endonuclease MutL [Planctomycetota bacterium]
MKGEKAAGEAGVIRVLDELVRNQIAAGEVIERPASVVKELVENAVDAGAHRIRVDLEEGGMRLVRVTDDGGGMGTADLERAFVPHATSKLCDAADLDHIASLGFRGEALASIGSVARCAIFSRRGGEELGGRIENEGGRLTRAVEAGGPGGTCVEARDLFFNTPARRRFLKRPSTELARCTDVLQRAALGQLGIGFVLTHDGARVLDVEPEMDLRSRVRRAFGADLASSLEEVEARDGTTRLRGLVAPPRFARRDSSRQMWFLNGRPLRDRVLLRCLKDAYRGFVLDGRQPVAFLHLAMDPGAVDVNVHPAKAEVRFRDGRRLFGFLVNALREGAGKTDMATPGASMLAAAAGGSPSAPGQGAIADPGPMPRGRRACEPLIVREVAEAQPLTDLPAFGPDGAATLVEPADDLAGPYLTIARTYVARAVPDGFEIVDQHALHERVTYEELLADARGGSVAVQRYLVPELVELSAAQVDLLVRQAPALGRIGIQLEAFGATTVAVGGLPARLRNPDPEELVRVALRVLEDQREAPAAEELLEDVLHSAACRSSAMAGDVLDPAEIRSLLERARAFDGARTCPHGRPTRVRFTLADLERAFGRR